MAGASNRGHNGRVDVQGIAGSPPIPANRWRIGAVNHGAPENQR